MHTNYPVSHGQSSCLAQSLCFGLLHGLAALGICCSPQCPQGLPSLSEVGHFCK